MTTVPTPVAMQILVRTRRMQAHWEALSGTNDERVIDHLHPMYDDGIHDAVAFLLLALAMNDIRCCYDST